VALTGSPIDGKLMVACNLRSRYSTTCNISFQSWGAPKYRTDGGLCLRIQKKGNFTLISDRVAILEAKRFHALEEGKPIISEANVVLRSVDDYNIITALGSKKPS
jgi:hypothetical protein